MRGQAVEAGRGNEDWAKAFEVGGGEVTVVTGPRQEDERPGGGRNGGADSAVTGLPVRRTTGNLGKGRTQVQVASGCQWAVVPLLDALAD